MIYNSSPYAFFSKRIDDFRDFKLLEQVKQGQIPEHVAIIMDGNRRFARGLGLPPKTGHIFGRDKLEEVLEWCFDIGIKNLTVYAFSTENFQRESNEVRELMDLCKNELKEPQKIHVFIKIKLK